MQVFHIGLDSKLFKNPLDYRVQLRDFWPALKDALALQRTQLFLWVPVFIAAGIALYFNLRFEPSSFVATSLVVFPIIGWLFLSHDERLRPILLFALCVGVGFMAGKLRTERVYTPILSDEVNFADV